MKKIKDVPARLVQAAETASKNFEEARKAMNKARTQVLKRAGFIPSMRFSHMGTPIQQFIDPRSDYPMDAVTSYNKFMYNYMRSLRKTCAACAALAVDPSVHIRHRKGCKAKG